MTNADRAIRDVLQSFGWEVTENFWHEYNTNIWVYNLTNALTATLARPKESDDEVVQVWPEPDWHPDYGYREQTRSDDK